MTETVTIDKPKPSEPVINPLHTLLHFIQALPGADPLAPVEPAVVFEAMREELPDLKLVDLVLAGGMASHLGKRLRKIAWALRHEPGNRG